MSQKKKHQHSTAKPDEPTVVTENQAAAADEVAAAVELEALKAALAEQQDKALRAQAEMENLRKRAEAELATSRKYAIERFATELLAVKDSLELAQSTEMAADDPATIDKMREGLALTLKQLESVFEKFALQVIDPQGEKFDPERHQAMSMLESDEVAPNHVINVIQKGYQLHDRLVRPALVVVAKVANSNNGQPAGEIPPKNA